MRSLESEPSLLKTPVDFITLLCLLVSKREDSADMYLVVQNTNIMLVSGFVLRNIFKVRIIVMDKKKKKPLYIGSLRLPELFCEAIVMVHRVRKYLTATEVNSATKNVQNNI